MLRTSTRAFLVSIIQKSHQILPDSWRLLIILEYIPGKVTDTLDRCVTIPSPPSYPNPDISAIRAIISAKDVAKKRSGQECQSGMLCKPDRVSQS
ncbi:hypothetical protein BD779DRAFT_1550899 [Infundibulicybe gibba]|nr:hypothetical protein BD779DRAFT_1550899 [Infundibulicybe gibba]